MLCQNHKTIACVCAGTWALDKKKKRTDKRHKFGGSIILMELCTHPKQEWFGEKLCGV